VRIDEQMAKTLPHMNRFGGASDEEPQGRILVVDDDEASVRGYSLLLRMSGFRVKTARDGEEALDLVGEGDFDVVVSDVNMPKLDGYELTRRLREEAATRDIPVILLSAVADSQRKVTGLNGGADDFMEKPVDADELLARIRVHLRHNTRNRELRHLSRYDAVTGVLTRAALEEELERELRRSQRTGLPVSVLMIDVDDFKAFNDRHGHTAGDAALRGVADKLVATLRATDLVGRYGGDELMAILPDTDEESARLLVDRVAIEWKRHPPIPRGTATPVRVSVGVATAKRDETKESIVRSADARMYDAKHAGRYSGATEDR
jgi:diguanylate cyclase (GGDEF)-like protein